MVRRVLPLFLTAALVVFAAPRVLGDNGGSTQLTHVENAARLALGEGIDEAGDKRFILSLRAVIESTVEQHRVIDIFPIRGSVKQRQVAGDLEVYALNCKLII